MKYSVERVNSVTVVEADGFQMYNGVTTFFDLIDMPHPSYESDDLAEGMYKQQVNIAAFIDAIAVIKQD